MSSERNTRVITIDPNGRRKTRLLHVETPLGIVNIWVGLTDIKGRRVERVDMLPNNYSGERKVVVYKRCVFRELKRKA